MANFWIFELMQADTQKHGMEELKNLYTIRVGVIL